MSIIEKVENMTAEELREARGSSMEELSKCKAGDLASRYLQAREDAKVRDVKLAEQAKTLEALQEGIEAVKAREAIALGEFAVGIEKAKAEVTSIGIAATAKLAAKDEEIEELSRLNAVKQTEVDDLHFQLATAAEKEILSKELLDHKGDVIEKLTTQANLYTGAIGQIQAMAMAAINAKAVADAS